MNTKKKSYKITFLIVGLWAIACFAASLKTEPLHVLFNQGATVTGNVDVGGTLRVTNTVSFLAWLKVNGAVTNAGPVVHQDGYTYYVDTNNSIFFDVDATNVVFKINGSVWTNSPVSEAHVQGQLYLDSDIGTETTYGLTNDYTTITNWSSTNLLNMEVVADTGISNQIVGMYDAEYFIGFNGGNAESYETAIFVDGVEQNHIEMVRTTSGTDAGSLSAGGFIDLTTGSEVLELRIKSLDAAADFTPVKMQFKLHKIN